MPERCSVALAPDLAEEIEPPQELIDAGLNGDLVLFVGAGFSRLMGLPTWAELADKALDYLRKAGRLNYSDVEQLRKLDPKKRLSIATLIAGEDHKLNFQDLLGKSSTNSDIYTSINAVGCPCVTTNYDDLLSPEFVPSKGGAATPVAVRRIVRRDKFFARHLDEPGSVVHLHGGIGEPESMIVTTKDYLSHYEDQKVQEFLGTLFARKAVLFLGYGLEEAEVLEHILRRGAAKNPHERKRFALQGFFRSDSFLYQSLHRYYVESFGVHILGYALDNERYHCQEKILRSWIGKLVFRPPPLTSDVELLDEVLGNE